MSQTYHILHTEASNNWGGQELRIVNETKKLLERGHKVELAGPADGKLAAVAKERGWVFHEIPFDKKTQLKDFFTLRKLIKEKRYDCVATHSSVDSWVGLMAAALQRVPCRLRYRHVSTPVKAHSHNRFQYRKLAHHTITTAEAITKDLVEKLRLDASTVTTVATGIETPDPLLTREEAHKALIAELKLPEQARFVGQVSVLRSWKGHDFLADAFAAIAEKYPDLHLVLAGEGGMAKVIEQKQKTLPCGQRIHLLGHRNDPWPIFRALDACVLASTRNEGIPQSLLQAMFAETAVIGTTAGGMPEIIDDGNTGFIVPASDSAALAEAIDKTLSNESETKVRIAKAHAYVQANHTLDQTGDRIEGIIASVLGA